MDSTRPTGAVDPTGAPIAEPVPNPWGLAVSVEEISGTLTAAAPLVNLKLVDMGAGQSLTAYIEATAGNLIPRLILRDYGGKPLEAGNLSGQEARRRFSTQ